MMTFADYDKAAEIFAVYPGSGTSNLTAVIYTALGLTGEAGEFADKIKKIMRDSQMTITEERRTSLIAELGDVLWYLSRAAQELDVSLDEVAYQNIQKLESRQARGTINGDGDDR